MKENEHNKTAIAYHISVKKYKGECGLSILSILDGMCEVEIGKMVL